MRREAHYIDPLTGHTYPIQQPRWCSDERKPLMLSDLPGISRDDIDTTTRSIWRYRAALPVQIRSPVSLGEGCSPLLELAWGALRPKFKLDWFNPTCSFKDRGSSVMISFLREQGIEKVLEDSSGNGGASVAAYGAAAGMAVKVLCPESASAAKIMQMRIFGADVETVPGSREATQAEALAQSKDIFYASHNWHPFFLQGTKSIAYEIWEDLGFRAPDNVVVPVGAGSSLLGCAIGFRELLSAGQIDRMPRLFATQPLNCSPVDAHFHGQSADRPVLPTIAEGTAIAKPLRMKEITGALCASGGRTVALTEQQIVDAVRALARNGLFVEPTCASAVAGLDVLSEAGAIGAGDETVVLLTGTGIKSSNALETLLKGQS